MLAPWPFAGSLAPSFIAGSLASYWISAPSGSLAHWLIAGIAGFMTPYSFLALWLPLWALWVIAGSLAPC